MTAVLAPAGALIITPDLFPAIRRAIAAAQNERRAAGQPPHPELVRLGELLARPVTDSPPRPVEEPRPLTAVEAAQLLGVTPRTVRRLAPRLDGHKHGAAWLIPAAAVQEHIEGAQPWDSPTSSARPKSPTP